MQIARRRCVAPARHSLRFIFSDLVCMSKATSTRSPSKLPSSAPASTPAFHHPVEDIELDDGLDDHELSDSEQLDNKNTTMGSAYRSEDSSGANGVKKMGEVANAISSCLALSFFSISMILANKVRGSAGGQRVCVRGLFTNKGEARVALVMDERDKDKGLGGVERTAQKPLCIVCGRKHGGGSCWEAALSRFAVM